MGNLAPLLHAMYLAELRSKEVSTLLSSLALIIAVVMGFGVAAVFLDSASRERLFPAAVWVCFVLNAAVSLGRTFEYEREHRVIDGLLVASVSPAAVYGAKVALNVVVLTLAHVIGVTALGMLFGVSVLAVLPEFALVSLLVLLAYSFLATLAAGVAAMSRVGGGLLPVLLLPLVLPLFFAGVELTTQLMLEARFDIWGSWGQLLMGLVGFYALCGMLLFEMVVRE
jgi:heme exporter protein B